MAVNLNIPSQVKPYANLAAFPATGAVKTIYIAEDTNKTYRWTGSTYVEISATAASTWGGITGTLSNQTDLQNALNTKQDTLVSGTNIKTINGTSVLGIGDISISTDLTIGTTPITSGTVGRVLFEGTGNVLSESANLFWDNTNERLGVGTSSPVVKYHQSQTQGIFARFDITNSNADQNRGVWEFYTNTAVTPDFFGRFGFKFEGGVNNASKHFQIHVADNTNPRFIVNGSGNVLIGTTTDAGYKLDVNGTARVGTLRLNSVGDTIEFNNTLVRIKRSSNRMNFEAFDGFDFTDTSISTTRIRIFGTTGNIGINTTTDAGFRLDVNGTARVSGNTTVSGSITLGTNQSLGDGNFSINVNRLESYNAYRIRTLADNRYVYLSPGNTDIFYANYWAGGNFAGVVAQDTAGTIQSTSAVLQANSTTRGFLPPRMTTTQKNAISTPATGLQVFDTTLNQMSYYNGTTWINL